MFPETRLGDEVGHVVPERDTETLPLDGEHAMALQIAERAVVRDELEAVVGALERAARAVPAIAAFAHVGLQQRDPVFVAEAPYPVGRLAFGAAEVGETRRHQDLLLAVRIEV